MIPAEFDEIRPYTPDELPRIIEELVADEQFRSVATSLFPGVPFEMLAAQFRKCSTNLEVQKTFFYPLLKKLMAERTSGTDMDVSVLNGSKNYTFVSNHRDIVIDSAFLSVLLLDNGFDQTVEIAIGDNLLVYPWIKKMVRVAKSFIVQRSLSMRQMLESSMRLSRYMHYAVAEKRENIWIAQREGRAKDSNDLTQDSVLKMMAMGGEGNVVERLRSLRIVPLAISYEYDPCDFLKAQEFQQKRDVEGFKKSREDDLLNMQTGIFGFKGHVHYQAAPCINAFLDTLDAKQPKPVLFEAIARHIDQEIHRNYRLYPGNYVAVDLLEGGTRQAAHYSAEEQAAFEKYLSSRIEQIKLSKPDPDFLRHKLLEMYANPALNYEKAQR